MKISETHIQVRYAETDQMGIVYHANYLIWFELGRTALIEELGFRYADMEDEGVLSPVTDIQISYKKPVTYGHHVLVRTWIEEYNGIKVMYGYEIINHMGDLCVTGTSSHVCVNKGSFRPISVKKRFPDWHEAYMAAKKEENNGVRNK